MNSNSIIIPKLKQAIIAFILLFTINPAFGQRGYTPSNGATSMSMGGIQSTHEGIDAILNNQAGLSSIHNFGFIASSEQRFLLSELVTIAAGAVYGDKNLGTFGLMMSSFGIDEFREQKIGFAYSRKLLDNLSIGGQLDYLSTRIDGYGKSSTITFELGIQSKVSKEVLVGFHIFSPGTIRQGPESDLPTQINAGISYFPSEKLLVSAEVEKIIDLEYSLRLGISYKIYDQLSLRAGASSGATTVSFGLAYVLNQQIHFEGAFSQHEILGTTPGASLKYLKK